MPDHRIEVIDLGLTVGDAITHDLTVERVTRQKALPARVLERLDETEREWFEGTRISGKSWRVNRVELNAFTSTALIRYVETRIEAELSAHGLGKKVVPPADVAEGLAAFRQHDYLTGWATERLAAVLNLDAIIDDLVAEFALATPDNLVDVITAAYDRDQTVSWRLVVDGKVEVDMAESEGERRVRFAALLREQIDQLDEADA